MLFRSRLLLLLAVTVPVVGCGPNIGSINANPPKYYETSVSIEGRVSRRQVAGAEALLELADDRERRILAIVPADGAPSVGETYRARGVVVADRRFDGVLVYDVIVVGATATREVPQDRNRPWWRFW